MSKKIFIDGGCSFTYGSELKNRDSAWPYQLHSFLGTSEHLTTAQPGSSNSGIARRVFQQVANLTPEDIHCVMVMWTFYTRYDWAMPEHKELDGGRWTSITPWDTNVSATERHRGLVGSEAEQEKWKIRDAAMRETGVRPFADAIYRNASNPYHEIYLSWKSIIWLQNILEKKNIPFIFTLADNSLFYDVLKHHRDMDQLMEAMHDEIDFTKWFTFGERMMGFNQWANLNGYKYATTHPLDDAHNDAVKLMLPTVEKIIGDKT